HLFRSKPRTLSPPGEVAAFKSERWPLSNRNRGRLQVGTVAAFKSEQVAAFRRNLHKTRSTARITEVASRLQKNPGLVSDQAQLALWQADVDNIQKSDALAALRGFRNVRLAHSNDPNVPDPRSKNNTRRVLCGDECIVLEGTIPIMERLNSLIGLRYRSDFNQIRHRWEQRADKFWQA